MPYINLNDVIKSINLLLNSDGIFEILKNLIYKKTMFEKISYDQIYDAHIYMFSSNSVQKIFSEKGFEINVTPQKTHGGSMKIYLHFKRKIVFQEN